MVRATYDIPVLVNVGWIFFIGGMVVFLLTLLQFYTQDKEEMRRRKNVT